MENSAKLQKKEKRIQDLVENTIDFWEDDGNFKHKKNKKMIKSTIEILKQLGVPSNILGHKYLVLAIPLISIDRSFERETTKKLYPLIANVFETTGNRVERAIRHAIENAFDNADPKMILNLFGMTIDCRKGKPTNSEFMSQIATEIKLQSIDI